jgi:glycoside hydrolase family 18
MKKLLLSLAAMALGMSAMAVETSYSIEFKADLNSNNQGTTITTSTGISDIVSNGASYLSGVATNPAPDQAYAACNYGLKVGANKKAGVVAFDIAADYQVVPTKVEIEYSASKNTSYQKLTFNDKACPDLTSTQTNATYATATFTDIKDVLKSIKFNKTNASSTSSQQGFIFVKKITVYYEQSGEGPKVAAPTFSLVKTAEGYAVEMSCATEGAQIYYTTSWDEAPADPTNASEAYSAPIDVWGMTYFKAIAYKGEEFSNVASYTANPPMVVEDFSNLVGAGFEEGQEALIEYRGNATVLYQNGSNIYVTDGNTGMCLYGSNSSTYSNGDVINGITGTYTVYKGLPEIKNYTLGEVTTGGAAVAPKEVELYLVNNSMLNQYVKLVGVNIAEGTDANNYVLSNADGDEAALYNQFKINMKTGENFTVTGIIGSFNNVQFMPITIEGGTVMETVATPVIEPASGELEANTEITITCATEGASIRYTVDGTDPTADSEEYLAPIVFTKAMTVKAIAVKDGMLDSEIAEAVYTLYDPTVPVSSEVTFDFTTYEGMTIMPADAKLPTVVSTGVDVTGFEKDHVTVTFDNTDATNPTRIWKAKDGLHLRAYKGGKMTFSCPSIYAINQIDFDWNSGYVALVEGQPGTYDPEWDRWTANKQKVQSVTFVIPSNLQLTKAIIKLEKTTGVEGVEVEEDAAPVYYNLQGVRVNNPERGIYIQVKGNKATKVVL